MNSPPDTSHIAHMVRLEEFCLSLPHASLFHSPRYIKLVAELVGAKDFSLTLEQDGKFKGYFPILGFEGTYGLVLNSSPFFGSNGGPLATDAECEAQLIQRFKLLCEDLSPVSSTVIENLEKPMNNILIDYNFIDERTGQMTHFSSAMNKASLLDIFHYKTRNSIRKGQKSGITIAIENSKLDLLYQTHVKNIQALSGIPKPKAFFDRFPSYFKAGTDWNLYTAHIDGKFAAALLLFYYNNVVEYYTPVIQAEFRDLQPLSALIFEAMQHAVGKGYRAWNWGGTWKTQEGVYRFKSRWGTTDHRYRYFTKLNQNILQVSQADIVKSYPYFYICPFDQLRTPLAGAQPGRVV